jgi:hypothetical protein
MNFLMPLMIGGPDMAKNKGPLGERLFSNSSTSNDKTKGYLAGLFEGDGHI